jgi:hypothetical protein
MRHILLCACLLIAAVATAQNTPSPVQATASSATVPITIDLNRVLVPVDITSPNGSTNQVQGLICNADPELWMSQRVAEMLDLAIQCNGQVCEATPKAATAKSDAASLPVQIGGMKIFLPLPDEIHVPAGNASTVPGTPVEITLPSTVLRNYDLLIDYPDRKLTISKPQTIRFKGTSTKVQINQNNGVIQVPSKIENRKYSFVLNLGASISWLSNDLFDKLASAHPDWPHMTGAVGSANLGTAMGANLKLMRVDRLQFGSLYLTDVPTAETTENQFAGLKDIAGPAAVGVLGADALQNYRVGLDYAHSLVYFDIGRTFRFPEFDVVGLTLGAEKDGRYSVIAVAGFEGQPSVPDIRVGDHLIAVDETVVTHSTIGQVWAMLGGSPGQERKLTIERNGKELGVIAIVRHFLGAAPEPTDRR